MKLITNENIYDELLLVLNMFNNNTFLNNDESEIKLNYSLFEDVLSVNITISSTEKTYNKVFNLIPEEQNNLKKHLIRYTKIALYQALCDYSKKELPWGSLTGIRPTKLYYELLEKNSGNFENSSKQFKEVFNVSEKRTEITEKIIKNQKDYYIKDDNNIDLYINIPFCLSRCYYCSFISSPIKTPECDLVNNYLNTLIYEIREIKKLIANKNLKIRSIYMGGGTPTSLTAEQLDKLLKEIPNENKVEFTVEAGRPDSITKEKLDVLEKYNVTRISINPQTFNDETLKAIGRHHSSKDIFEKFELARKYKFIINMDLIAGLMNEDIEIFKDTLNKTLELKPDNITVHTLCVKNASILKDGGQTSTSLETEKMVNYSIETLSNAGYEPYYLYRQKNALGNFENIGYFKDNTICINNINSMEEISSIIAVGANAISKRYIKDLNRIERCANVKNIQEYIDRIDEMINRKIELFNKEY